MPTKFSKLKKKIDLSKTNLMKTIAENVTSKKEKNVVKVHYMLLIITTIAAKICVFKNIFDSFNVFNFLPIFIFILRQKSG